MLQSLISPQIQSALEAQALREGLITRDEYVYGELHNFSKHYERLGENTPVLQYLTLFPEIEGTDSEFSMEKTVKSTGLQYRSMSPRLLRSHTLHKSLDIDEDVLASIMEECHDRAYQSFYEQRRQILPILYASLVNEWEGPNERVKRGEAFYTGSRVIMEAALNSVDALTGWYCGDLSASPWGQEVGGEEMLREAGIPNQLLDDPDFSLWLDKLDDFYVRHFATILWSTLNRRALTVGATGRRRHPREATERAAAAKAAALISVQFRDELRLVPDPRTISEAIEMSQSREMSRLREKIFEWIDETKRNPSIDITDRVRQDIEKASRELRNLRRYKELNESPWVFTLKFALGNVPVISNVVGVVDYGFAWWDKISAEKNVWVAIK